MTVAMMDIETWSLASLSRFVYTKLSFIAVLLVEIPCACAVIHFYVVIVALS